MDEQFFSMIFSSVVPEADVGYYAFGTESSKLGNVYAEAQNVAKGWVGSLHLRLRYIEVAVVRCGLPIQTRR